MYINIPIEDVLDDVTYNMGEMGEEGYADFEKAVNSPDFPIIFMGAVSGRNCTEAQIEDLAFSEEPSNTPTYILEEFVIPSVCAVALGVTNEKMFFEDVQVVGKNILLKVEGKK